MWNKPKKENWRLKLGFIKPHKKVSKEQYRKDMAEFCASHKKKLRENKRVSDKKAQAEYFERHPFCEVSFYEGKGKIPANDVHEIKYKSQGGKCIESNMISLTRDNHDKAHLKKRPYLRKDVLMKAKEIVEEVLKEEGIICGK